MTGPDDALLPEVAKDADDNLAHRPDGLGQSLLTDVGDQPIVAALL